MATSVDLVAAAVAIVARLSVTRNGTPEIRIERSFTRKQTQMPSKVIPAISVSRSYWFQQRTLTDAAGEGTVTVCRTASAILDLDPGGALNHYGGPENMIANAELDNRCPWIRSLPLRFASITLYVRKGGALLIKPLTDAWRT